MQRSRLFSILLITLGAFGPAAAVSCGGVARDVGTETGNPPVLDKLLLRLEVRDSGVYVIGEPGAVSPGGALVTVRNLSTGESRTVSAAADGSFSVQLGGGLEDGYDVTVSANGMDATSGVKPPEVIGGSDGSGPPIEPPYGMGGSDGSGPPVPACDAPAILVQNCGGATCHGAGSTFSAFAASEASVATFVDAEPTSICSGVGLVIDSEIPEDSLIVTKLGPNPPCGGPMPLGRPGAIRDDEIACIVEWIESLEP